MLVMTRLRLMNEAAKTSDLWWSLLAAAAWPILEMPGSNDTSRALAEIAAFFATVQAAGVTPFSVGGNHSISLPILRVIARDRLLGMVHVDAHCDTGDDYLGSRAPISTGVRAMTPPDRGPHSPSRLDGEQEIAAGGEMPSSRERAKSAKVKVSQAMLQRKRAIAISHLVQIDLSCLRQCECLDLSRLSSQALSRMRAYNPRTRIAGLQPQLCSFVWRACPAKCRSRGG
jgi:hypothetical protein